MDGKLIFKGIVGSQAFGTATETSDIDYKAVYIQSKESILSNRYVPYIEESKDSCIFEIRKFLELVSVGNPNALELLFLPDRCIEVETEEWLFLKSIRTQFLTKVCYNTFSGYAKTQLQKAQGLNKKMNWDEKRIERKNVLDFCKIVDRGDGFSFSLNDWLKENGFTQDQLGLVSLDGFRDTYKVYVDEIKWVNDNHRFTFEERNYRGVIQDDNTNEPRLSEIEKYMIDSWKGIMYWNREAYSTSCREFREYEKWQKNRNEVRFVTNKAHNQMLDGKNIAHTVRLIMTAMEIPTQKTINVDRTTEREYLLSIKHGKVDLQTIMDEWGKKVDELKKVFDESDLPDNMDLETVKNLEYALRSY